MESLSAFFDMGGYAAFVWPAYALAVAGLLSILVQSKTAVNRLQRDLDRLRPPRETPTSSSDPSSVNAGANPGEA